MGRLPEIIQGVIARHGRYGTLIDTRVPGRLPRMKPASDQGGRDLLRERDLRRELHHPRGDDDRAAGDPIRQQPELTAAFFGDEPRRSRGSRGAARRSRRGSRIAREGGVWWARDGRVRCRCSSRCPIRLESDPSLPRRRSPATRPRTRTTRRRCTRRQDGDEGAGRGAVEGHDRARGNVM